MEEWLGDLDKVDKKAVLEHQKFEELQQAKKQETENLKNKLQGKKNIFYIYLDALRQLLIKQG